MMRPTLILMACSLLAQAGPAFAAPAAVSGYAEPSPTQFYLLSFSDASVAEIADAVIVGSLGQDFTVDPAVTGTMDFRLEGAFTDEALLQELGTALMDQDIALLRMRDRSLVMVPRENLALTLAKGGALIALPRPGITPARPPAAPAASASRIVYGQDRWWDGALGGLLLFLSGAAGGAAALAGGQWIWRRNRAKAVSAQPLRLTMAVPVSAPDHDAVPADPELVIPAFEARPRVQ